MRISHNPPESSRENFFPKIGTIIVTLVCLFTTIMQTSTYFKAQDLYFNPRKLVLFIIYLTM